MTGPPENLFAELFSLVQPGRFLAHPAATGAGVRVCIVDTGLDRERLAERARLRGRTLRPIEGVMFREEVLEPIPDAGRASSPHGTTVADILLDIAPEIDLTSADVFGPAGSCDVRVLIRAIRWAMDTAKCKLINLSLGIPEPRLLQLPRRQELQRIVEEAYYRDVVIVAAANNDHPHTRSFPALFAPPLVSVNKADFADPLLFAYRLHEQVEFEARGHGPFGNQPATSWATPHLSGIIARLLSLRPTLKPFEIKTLLYWMATSG